MATLHEVTDKTKKIILAVSLFILGCLTLYFSYRGYIYVRELLFPTPPIPPNTVFGKLPKINFPEPIYKTSHTYELDTVTGKLPVFNNEDGSVRDRVPVYEFSDNELTLLDLQNTRSAAASTGFAPNGYRLDGDIYRFTKDDSLPKTLDINILTKNFKLTSNYLSHTDDLLPALAPSVEKAVDATNGFLGNLGISTEDVDPTKVSVQYIAFENQIPITVDSQEEAQLVRIDLIQKDVSGLPIFYPQATKSIMYFVASGPPSKPDIVLASFTHKKVKEGDATYPLKNINLAYEELASGSAYISLDNTKSDPVKIKEVQLGYLIISEDQKYLMPIYVFKGEDNLFYAYVSAIDDSWIDKTSTLE